MWQQFSGDSQLKLSSTEDFMEKLIWVSEVTVRILTTVQKAVDGSSEIKADKN